MLTRIGRFSYRRRRLVVGLWIAALIVAIAAGPAIAGDTATSGRLPNTDSQRAYDALAREFPQRHGDEGRIVFADARLDHVVRELNRWYDLDIRLADTSLARLHVTATFTTEPVADVLRFLTTPLELTYERAGRTIVLRRQRTGSGR